MTLTSRSTAAGAAAALAGLLAASPGPVACWHGVRDAAAATDPTGPLVAGVGLVAWALTGWLLTGVLLSLGARLPGWLGRCLDALAASLLPRALRRSLELALGLSLAAGTTTAPAWAAPLDPAAPPTAPTTALDLHETPAPDLDWVVPASEPVEQPVTTAEPALPAPPPPAAAPAPAATTAPTPPLGRSVTVQPGDTLWALAARDLARGGGTPSAAAVAAHWPAWWAANRDAVGPDPDLLLPGQHLTAPPA